MKLLVLDIETSPNLASVWGLWNQNIGINQIIDSGNTMCFSAKWYKDPEIIFASEYHHGELPMLSLAHQLLSQADAVVHYNGNKFDIPTLNKEFILHDFSPPDPFHQIDLLRVARQRFKFPSNKLDYIAKALGLGQKVKHIGHELWIQCMNKDHNAWKIMEEYNKQDVILLEKVYEKMLPWIKDHPNHGLYSSEIRPVCPNCGSHLVVKKGVETTKLQSYQRYRCTKCGTPLRGKHSILDKEVSKSLLVGSKL